MTSERLVERLSLNSLYQKHASGRNRNFGPYGFGLARGDYPTLTFEGECAKILVLGFISGPLIRCAVRSYLFIVSSIMYRKVV